MTVELFTDQEWRLLDPALQSLGEVSALAAIIEAGSTMLADFDGMSENDRYIALLAAENWPHEPVDPNGDDLPVELMYSTYGSPKDQIWQRVRECQCRLDILKQAQAHQHPDQLEADIQELLNSRHVPNRTAAVSFLNDFTVQDARNIEAIISS